MNILLLLFACHPAKPITDLEYTPSTVIDTVGIARFSTEQPTSAWIEFGEGLSFDRTTSVSDGVATDHALILAGFAGGVSYKWKVVAEAEDGTRYESDTQKLETSAPPDSLATFSLYRKPAASEQGYTLLTTLSDQPALVIIDMEGRPVWWKQMERTFLSRVVPDGNGLVYNARYPNDGSEFDGIFRIDLLQSAESSVDTPDGHHDFVTIPGEGWAYIARDLGTSDEGWSIVGDKLVEVMYDGTLREVWSTWNDLEVNVTPETDNGFYNDGLDWTHCNGVDYDSSRRLYVVSCKKQDAVYGIDRDTGALLWQAGGSDSDLTLLSGTAPDALHGPRIDGDTLWIFDNRQDDTERFSRAAAYTLDTDAKTWMETWSYSGTRNYEVVSHGNVQPLPSGNRLIAWGDANHISEVDVVGSLIWEVEAHGADLGYVYRTESLGGTLDEEDTGL